MGRYFNFFFEKMKLAFLLFAIAQVFAEGASAPGDAGGTQGVFINGNLEKVEALLEVVDGKPSPGNTKTHILEIFQEFKLDEEDDSEEEEEASDLVELEGKLAEDDTEKHEELYDTPNPDYPDSSFGSFGSWGSWGSLGTW